MVKLTQREILQALLDGKKIRQPQWKDKSEYVHLKDGKLLLNSKGYDLYYTPLDLYDYWELYIETVSFFEALEALKDGKKVRQLNWDKDKYIYKGKIMCLNSWVKSEYLFNWEDTLASWIILEGDESGSN